MPGGILSEMPKPLIFASPLQTTGNTDKMMRGNATSLLSMMPFECAGVQVLPCQSASSQNTAAANRHYIQVNPSTEEPKGIKHGKQHNTNNGFTGQNAQMEKTILCVIICTRNNSKCLPTLSLSSRDGVCYEIYYCIIFRCIT